MSGSGSLRREGVVATIIAALIWSTGGLFIKWIDASPFTILFWRSLLAGLFFFICFRQLKIDKRVILITLWYAPLLICFVTATKLTTAANAIFLQYTAPIFVLLAEPRITGGRLKRIDLITVIICTLGLSLFLVGPSEDQRSWLGDGLALLSGIFQAGLLLTMRVSTKEQQSSGLILGNFMIVAITFYWWDRFTSFTTFSALALLFLGVVQIGIGYLLFTYGQRRIPATESALLAMIEPVLNPVWVAIGYGEWPGIYALTGGFIILAAIAFRIIHRMRITYPV